MNYLPSPLPRVLLLLSLFGFFCMPGYGSTWYVRPDGGTRYTAKAPKGQCDGLTDAAYRGSGTNQHCAFNDVRWLWSDGEYANISSFPSWGWVVQGGDTVILRGSIGTGVSYRSGWNNPNNAHDTSTDLWFGFNNDPYDSTMPPIPSGTAANPTRILGENYQSCSTQKARTQIHGGYGITSVLNMKGSSYVDLECLDITDFSSCSGVGSASVPCSKNAGKLTDNAQQGIVWTNTATHDTLNNIRIHGLSGSAMSGPTGDGVVMTNIAMIGNGGAGWNADPSDGTTGTGSLLVQNFDISWNGCAEQYPIVDALPYFQCADDSSQGYGDGFGTATVLTKGWNVHFDHGVVSYNTQDGLDALHLVGPGSSMTITHVLAYGNMGQQIKNGGEAGTTEDSQMVTNCNALRYPIPGTPPNAVSFLATMQAVDNVKATETKGSNTLTHVSGAAGIGAGWYVYGDGFPDQTVVTAVDGGTITLNHASGNTELRATFSFGNPVLTDVTEVKGKLAVGLPLSTSLNGPGIRNPVVITAIGPNSVTMSQGANSNIRAGHVMSAYNSNLSDFCRAADAGVLITTGKGAITKFHNNVVYSASSTAVEVGCDTTNGQCDSTSLIDFRNNIILGFKNDAEHGYAYGGSGDLSNPIYVGDDLPDNPFTNAGSIYSNNTTFHGKSNANCPARGEKHAHCGDPHLLDETWHNYGYGDMSAAPGSQLPSASAASDGDGPTGGLDLRGSSLRHNRGAEGLGAGVVLLAGFQGVRLLRRR